MTEAIKHPHRDRCSRRTAVQAGVISLLGLGMNHLDWLHAEGVTGRNRPRVKSVIYIFLSGGLAQHESFDMKPDAPSGIRGKLNPNLQKQSLFTIRWSLHGQSGKRSPSKN